MTRVQFMSIWHLFRMVSLLKILFKRRSAGQENMEKIRRRGSERQIGPEHESRLKSIVPSSENDQSTMTASDNMFSRKRPNVFARIYGKLKAEKRLKVGHLISKPMLSCQNSVLFPFNIEIKQVANINPS